MAWVLSWRPGDTSQPRGSRRTRLWNRMSMREKWDGEMIAGRRRGRWVTGGSRRGRGGTGQPGKLQTVPWSKAQDTALQRQFLSRTLPPPCQRALPGPGHECLSELTRCLVLWLLALVTWVPCGCGCGCCRVWCGGGARTDPTCLDGGGGVAGGAGVGFAVGCIPCGMSILSVASAWWHLRHQIAVGMLSGDSETT